METGFRKYVGKHGKRVLSLFVVFWMLCPLIPANLVHAANGDTLEVSVSCISAAQQGDYIYVDISVTDSPAGVHALFFSFGFDASFLQVVEVTSGGLMAGTMPSLANPLWFNFFANPAVQPDETGVLATIRFRVLADFEPDDLADFTFTGLGGLPPTWLNAAGVQMPASSLQFITNCTPGAPVTVDATCTEPGSITIRCTRCDVVISIEPIPALGHLWGEWFIYTPAECGVPGLDRRNCLRANCNYFETRPVDALEHDWSDWVVTTPPTCGVPGVETRTCSHCQATETRPVDALEHDWSDWVVTTPPGCGIPGEETRTCSHCQATETRPVDALEHDWSDWVVTTPPTCGVPGVETRTCSHCQATETRPVDALEHDWSDWILTTPPECGIPGVETRTCSHCQATETRPVDALEHDWSDWVVTTPPGCGIPGEETRTCSHCQATETRPVDALEHDWSEWILTTPPTCGVPGEETRTCSHCQATETRLVYALEHDWGEWFIVTPADCGNPGLERRECQRAGCDHYETRVIPPLDCDLCPYCGECLDCSECLEFNFNIFNNGPLGDDSTPNEGLANAGLIRMWTQVGGVNANLAYPANVSAVFLGTETCAMYFVRIGRIWEGDTGWLDYFNLIDVRKTDAWEFIELTIIPFGCHLPVTVLLHNGDFVAEFDVTFIVNVGAVGVYATYTRTIQVPVGEEIPLNLIPAYAARRGFYFAGWYLGVYPDWVPYHPAYFGPVNEALIFTARFNLLWHYVTFVAGEGGTLELATGQTNPLRIRDGMTIAAGQVPTPVPDSPCHRFVEWRLEDVATNPVGFNPTGNVTFVAIFEGYCEAHCPDCGECLVCSECLTFSFDIFNNGPEGCPSRPNASLEEAGIIRMWTQLGGVNYRLPWSVQYTITATVRDSGECAIDLGLITVTRMWEPGGFIDFFSRIDIDKNHNWEFIDLTITVCGVVHTIVLHNALYPIYTEYRLELAVTLHALDPVRQADAVTVTFLDENGVVLPELVAEFDATEGVWVLITDAPFVGTIRVITTNPGFAMPWFRAGYLEVEVGVYVDRLLELDVTLFLWGDLNHDGTATPLDLVMLQQFWAGYDVPGLIMEAADLDGDGLVTPLDLILFQMFWAGFPVGPNAPA